MSNGAGRRWQGFLVKLPTCGDDDWAEANKKTLPQKGQGF
jgi:hypothetical protein